MLQRLVHMLPLRVRAFLRRIPVLVALYQWLRRGRLTRERYVFVGLALLAIVIGVAAPESRAWAPSGALVLTILGGGLLLRVRALSILLALVAVMVGYNAWHDRDAIGPGMIATLLVTSVLAFTLARTRQQLGVVGLRGDSMLLELRDRLRRQGEMPELPPGWDSQVVMLQAGGSSFGGDFFVSVCDGTTLEVALVDVSGKGVDAGTRALMLSGAFGSLLGSLQPERFLPACNRYLHRQRWDEGFVTAVHVVIDLASGEYTVESAGHPPAVQFDAGTGKWQVSPAKGVVLGVLQEMECVPERGVLLPGDALLLYTDGLVESPGRDLDAGIDGLLGEAERLVPQGFRHGARELVETMAAARDDDCALVVIWRS
ncbi:PP2C family protein-serine/threonine phosphatase [Actinomadura parmotrematis]|uniref:Serine/threonine-protein phosphatase n=1 Tax=Actinomadura parmotrematis TaxID=2864039 RepID=A0ABS7FW16_9ACTN|nr:PP2C family protein-serine/threonine phosphatase [Actinomadura parmotrematis]MBW8484170.1 serine/threonine-protein phosphatase [Actinomadura parmotrematis]